VFRSRLGATNIVLPLASFAFQPAVTLSRRLEQQLSAIVDVDTVDSVNTSLFEYLQEKRLVGSEKRKTGRYTGFTLQRGEHLQVVDHADNPLTSVKLFQTDIWLADLRVASTIGVPTAENSEELLELCFQLGLLLRSKSTWTAAGQLTAGLRTSTPGITSNPMVLGLEALALLRQILEKDGLLLRELLREICSAEGSISRDEIALRLPAIAGRALASARQQQLPTALLSEGKKFVVLLEQTAKKRSQASRAPGVLEHRISPRLEWLVDFGALTKQGLPRNAFEYHVMPDAQVILGLLDSHLNSRSSLWSDDAALGYWRTATHWASLRGRLPHYDVRSALRRGYVLMRRTVGPCAIREVCFSAGILLPSREVTIDLLSQELLAWASAEPRIKLSGGRFTRKPELVHMTDEVLNEG
jgi:hypothetical protein